MKKSSLATLCVLAMAAVFFGLILVGLVTAEEHPWFPGPEQESLSTVCRGASGGNGCHDIVFIVTAVQSARIDTVKVRTSAGACTATNYETIKDFTISFNGTARTSAGPLCYQLKTGDNVQIDVKIPNAQYVSDSTMSITVFTPKAMYYQETTLP